MPKITVTEPDGSSSKYSIPLEKKVLCIGRSSVNHIILKSPTVSSRHCNILKTKKGYLITDLNSTSGTSIEEKKLKTIEVKHNLTFKAADVAITIEFSEEEISNLVIVDNLPPTKIIQESPGAQFKEN